MNLFYGDALENEGHQNEEDVEDFLALLVEEPVVKQNEKCERESARARSYSSFK